MVTDKVSKFVVFEDAEGSVVYVRRSQISSFQPIFVKLNRYRILATVGEKTFAVHHADTVADARSWIESQIALIEKELNEI